MEFVAKEFVIKDKRMQLCHSFIFVRIYLCYVKFLADKVLANFLSGVDKYTILQQNWIKCWFNKIKECKNFDFVSVALSGFYGSKDVNQ